jgi:hypothetical protein
MNCIAITKNERLAILEGSDGFYLVHMPSGKTARIGPCNLVASLCGLPLHVGRKRLLAALADHLEANQDVWLVSHFAEFKDN